MTNTIASSGLSSNMARYRELGSQINRIKKDNDKEHKNSSARLAVIERQLHRFDDFESTIARVKDDMAGIRREARDQFNHFEERMIESLQHHVNAGSSVGSMSTRLDRLTELVEAALVSPSDSFPSGSPQPKKQYPSPTILEDTTLNTRHADTPSQQLQLTASTEPEDAHMDVDEPQQTQKVDFSPLQTP